MLGKKRRRRRGTNSDVSPPGDTRGIAMVHHTRNGDRYSVPVREIPTILKQNIEEGTGDTCYLICSRARTVVLSHSLALCYNQDYRGAFVAYTQY
jgi:hypothetical protein